MTFKPISSSRRIFKGLFLLFCFALPLAFSTRVSAFSVYNSVEPTGNVWRKENNVIQEFNGSSWVDTSANEKFRIPFENTTLAGRRLVYALGLKNSISVQEGLYYSVPLYYQWGYPSGNVAYQKGIIYTFGTSNDFELVDYDIDCIESGETDPGGQSLSGAVAYTCRANFLLKANITGNAKIQLGLTDGTVFMIFPSYSHAWVSIDDITELLSVSNSEIVSSIDSLRGDTQAQTEQIQSGNNEAQQRWEDDKQEESDREEAGQEDAEILGDLFSFNIANPFSGLLTLFTDSCPVSIPTIASMLGSNQTTYPCWFSSSTRSILTPVIGIFASVVLFGFVVRGFLNKGNFSGGIEI